MFVQGSSRCVQYLADRLRPMLLQQAAEAIDLCRHLRSVARAMARGVNKTILHRRRLS